MTNLIAEPQDSEVHVLRNRNPRQIRQYRRFAGAVVILPPLATILALVMAWHLGIHWVSIIILVVMYVAGMIGLSVGFHRHLAHRSFKARRVFRALLTILGCINAQGSPLFWVATHRRHHSISDQPGDPFSPNLSGPGIRGWLRGIWHAYIGWMFADDPTDPVRFCRDLLLDKTIMRINRSYLIWVLAGLVLPGLVVGFWTGSISGGVEGTLWGGFARIFLVNQAVWSVGTYCHLFGTRPFSTDDRSTNNFLVALLSFGEGLHNNHHAFPSCALLSFHWWEPDFGGWFIRMFRRAGLISEVRIPTEQSIRARKQS